MRHSHGGIDPGRWVKKEKSKKKKINSWRQQKPVLNWNREATQPTNNQPNKIMPTPMFDPENPENFVNGKESVSPELAGVNSTDDGFSCGGNENDHVLALLKEFGF